MDIQTLLKTSALMVVRALQVAVREVFEDERKPSYTFLTAIL